ncbi:PHD and WAC Acf1 DNA bd domain containing protein [Trichuris trichiura]|uniref:PHD and WAC Acf1 DNA bd domain containing protein n=1 Tax=Trichuris trichiura TaxID=36087 RepID=A0A077YZW7_TRITR|nr:PHD and WAC Acf1 DNA bd domain containing protein [Trichuris trichiura]
MPLHGKTFYVAQPNGSDLLPCKAPFVPLQLKSREELLSFYDEIGNLMESKQWACRTLGRFELTFTQALACEEKCRRKVESEIAQVFCNPILAFVHGKVQPLNAVVNDTHSMLSVRFFPGETVAFTEKERSSWIGEITGLNKRNRTPSTSPVLSNCSKYDETDQKHRSVFNSLLLDVQPKSILYNIRIFSPDDRRNVITNVSPSAIRRVNYKLPTHKTLRLFVRTFAYKKSYMSSHLPWLVDSDKLEELGIAEEGHENARLKEALEFNTKSKSPSGKKKKNKKEKGCVVDAKRKMEFPSTDLRRYFKTETDAERISDIGNRNRCGKKNSESAASSNNETTRSTSSKRAASASKQHLLGEDTSIVSDKTLRSKCCATSPAEEAAEIITSICSPPKAKQRKTSEGEIDGWESKLAQLWSGRRNGEKAKNAYNKSADLVVKISNISQLEKFKNEDIRADLLRRFHFRKEREKLKAMSVEEKLEYLRQKRKEYRLRIIEERKKVEDKTILPQSLLPEPEPVELPDGITSSMFGDVLCIFAFIESFAGLLDSEGLPELSFKNFLEHLRQENISFVYLNEMLIIFLEALLKDQKIMRTVELDTLLVELELNLYTAPEFARILLRQQAKNYQNSDEGSDDCLHRNLNHSQDTVLDSIVENLGLREFHLFNVQMKLQTFILLMDLLLRTKTVGLFTQKLQEDFKNASLEKHEAETKLKNKLRQAGKEFKRAKSQAENCQRFSAIGMDRNFSRYWFFGSLVPGLYVEKVSAFEIEYNGIDELHKCDDDAKTYCDRFAVILSFDFVFARFPADTENLWYRYGNEAAFDQLVNALLLKGRREGPLKEVLIALRPNIINSMISRDETKEISKSQTVSSHRDMFEQKLLEFGEGLMSNNIGIIANYDQWKERVTSARKLSEFKEPLIKLQQCVKKKLLKGMMRIDVKHSNPHRTHDGSCQPGLNLKNDGTEKVETWRNAVLQCTTWSRLFLLMYILRACIKWKKSVYRTKCLICRKVAEGPDYVSCEVCDVSYHIYCLRPPLDTVPDQVWYCKLCKPLGKGNDSPLKQEDDVASQPSDTNEVGSIFVDVFTT